MTSKLIPSPYQLVHLSKLLVNQLDGLLICDGVGVGKTISAAYVIALHFVVKRSPIGVVCPPILVPKWRLELREKFGIPSSTVANEEVLQNVIEDADARSRLLNPIVYVLPYSLLSSTTFQYTPTLSLVVFDEIHTARNPGTQIYKSALQIASGARQRIGLTATPVHNSLADLSSELSILFPRYSLNQIKAVVSEIWGLNRGELLRPVLTRFLKESLGTHFCRREISTELIRFPAGYTETVEGLLETEDRKTGLKKPGAALANTTRYRMAASSPVAFYSSLGIAPPGPGPDTKTSALLRLIEGSPNERWIIFCEFVETAKEVTRRIGDRLALLLTGGTPEEQRLEIFEAFHANPEAVLVLTSVGSEGLDLQVCSRLVNFDLHW
ncbi:MAG: helicase-related protein, partial [Nitrososphaerales archaeon]